MVREVEKKGEGIGRMGRRRRGGAAGRSLNRVREEDIGKSEWEEV